MNQNQIDELILEALVTTEIDVTRGICQCRRTLIELTNKYSVRIALESFDGLLLSTCISLEVYSGIWLYPIQGELVAYKRHQSNLWDMDTEYGQIRHRVYDQMIFTLQDKLGITV